MSGFTICNDSISIHIKSKGAELANLQSVVSNKEYLWQADPQYWGRHSCILFPYIGKMWNNKLMIGDKIYNANQHGFLRDLEFDLISQKNDELIFRNEWSEQTLDLYPYKYAVEIHYRLIEAKIETTYVVENMDSTHMPFSVGCHPGFVVPLNEGEKRSDYSLLFEYNETAPSFLLNDQGYLNGKVKDVFKNTNKINLTDHLFDEDALIFRNLRSKRLHLVNKNHEKIWSFSFEGFNYLGIWSKNQNSPFVCIEPWVGVADKVGASWDFRDKEGVLSLAAGDRFECWHSVLIH